MTCDGALRALPESRTRRSSRAPSASWWPRSTRGPIRGLAGVRQLTGGRDAVADDPLLPERRAGRSARRSLSERWPVRPRWAGERELDLSRLRASEFECDWTSGSFMLARRDALLSAGLLDERFFIYSEEPDLCLRMKRAGWDVRHLPLDDDRPSRRKGGRAPEDGRAGRVHAPPVRAQAFHGTTSRRLSSPPWARPCAARGGAAAGRNRRATSRRRTSGAAHARRTSRSAIRISPSDRYLIDLTEDPCQLRL